jgi:hypothetical protein
MLPVFRRYSIADYPKAPEWLGQFFQSLNLFSETTVQTLNKNLLIGQNVQGMKYTTSFTTSADYDSGVFQPIQFSYTGGGQPDCCLLGNIVRQDTLPNQFQITVSDWFLNINANPFRVTINYVAGLLPSTAYTATFLVL